MSAPSLRERVVSGVFWLTATRASGQIITWIITIIVVRLLSPADYGLMGMALLFAGVLFLFNEIGLGAAIVQKSELSADQISDLRWVILVINVALFAVLLLLAPAVAAYFDEPRLVLITRVLAISFLINGVGVPSASILQREMAFKEKAAAELMGNLAGGISTLVLAWRGYGVWSLVVGYLALRLVTNAIYCVCRPPVFRRAFSMSNVKRFTEFGVQVAVARILWFFSSSADVMIVGKVLGSTQLGYYSLAFQYSSLPLEKFVTLLNEIAFPSFASVQNDTARLQRHYLKLVNFVALVTFPMFVGLFLVADNAVAVMLGARWLPVVVPLKLLCIVSCFRAIETVNAPVALASGRPRVVMLNTLLGVAVLPVAFYVGARQGGIDGVALAWLLTRPFLFAVVTYRTLQVVGLRFDHYLRGLWHPIAGSLVMVATVVTVSARLGAMRPLAQLVVCSLVGCVVYVAYNVLFNSVALREVLGALGLEHADLPHRRSAARGLRRRPMSSPQRRDELIGRASETEHPRILLAAYHFPPSAAVGGLRITRFARFLPEFGWRPYVLTIDDADRGQGEGTDRSRLAGLEAVSITRTRAPSGILDLYSRIKRKVLRFRKPPGGHGAAVGTRARPAGETIAQRLRRYATSLFVLLPDEEKNWALFAAVPAVRLIRRHRIDCILTSAPPYSVHFVGLVAKLVTRVTWVADFRDPWMDDVPPAHCRSWLSERLQHWMEARVMNNADRVLATTERMRDAMMARYPHLPGEKFSCLPNGIDVGGLAAGDIPDKYAPLTITYAGSLYLDRTPEPLFEALGALVNEGKVRLDDFRIKLVGSCRFIGDVETEAVARRYGVESAVEIIDRLPRTEAIRIMQRSHLLLVLAPPNHRLVLPAKIFDYLGSGSKLLALTEPGATADLMRETDGGMCFSQKDVSGLKAYFHELLTDGSYRQLRNDPESFLRYDARGLTGQLVAEFSGQPTRPSGVIVRT